MARAVRETSHAYKFHHPKNSPTSNISNYKKNPPNPKIKTLINPISNKPKNPNQGPPLQINWPIFLDPLLPTNLTNFITPIYTTQPKPHVPRAKHPQRETPIKIHVQHPRDRTNFNNRSRTPPTHPILKPIGPKLNQHHNPGDEFPNMDQGIRRFKKTDPLQNHCDPDQGTSYRDQIPQKYL